MDMLTRARGVDMTTPVTIDLPAYKDLEDGSGASPGLVDNSIPIEAWNTV
jgi:hypothetical protein